MPGPALVELLLPDDRSYPDDGSPPTLEQAKILGRTLTRVTQSDRELMLAGEQAYAYDTRVGWMEDPAQRMMREAEQMRAERDREFLAACPPIVDLSPTVSSVGNIAGPAPTPRIVVRESGADDEAIVMWNESVQRATRATAAHSPVRSPGDSPPGFDSAFVSGAPDAWFEAHRPAVQTAIERLGVHEPDGSVRLARRPRPHRETPPAFSPGVLEPPSYFEMSGDRTPAVG